MITYADTSVLLAWFHADDQFALPVTRWVQENVTEFVWNPILRAELRHNIRKLTTGYARTAWNAMKAAEKGSRLILGRDRLSDLLERADELSAANALLCKAGTWDFVHVAAAVHVRAQCFATCDSLQAELTRAVQIPRVKLFKA